MGFSLFDVLTSVPVSFVEHYVAQLCAESAGADAPLAAGEMRFVRVIKPLRWFKDRTHPQAGQGTGRCDKLHGPFRHLAQSEQDAAGARLALARSASHGLFMDLLQIRGYGLARRNPHIPTFHVSVLSLYSPHRGSIRCHLHLTRYEKP